MRQHEDLKRSLRGAVWGLTATVMMTAFMVIGALVFRSSIARPPFPYLFIDHLMTHAGGEATAALTVVAHFGFGALLGVLFAFFSEPMTLAKGAGFATLVWSVMQVIFVPWLGWGDFAFMHSSAFIQSSAWAFIWYTLVLHMIYGVTLGVLGARDDRVHQATFDDLGHLKTHTV
jgi:hypothetical protein